MVSKEQLVKDYNRVPNREKFIDYICDKYNMQWQSAKRRYYDVIKIVQYNEKLKKAKLKINRNPKEITLIKDIPVDIEYVPFARDYNPERQPDKTKMLIINDMIKYKYPLTNENLLKYGFFGDEIVWLKNNGYIKKPEVKKCLNHIQQKKKI